MAATGLPPTRDEVRWMLTNWVDGPDVLFLNDNFQRFRANQKPVFNVLDRDRDGVVSAKELQLAVTSFQECDLNRNDIVDYTEIAQVAEDPRQLTDHAGPGKLIFPIPHTDEAAASYRRMADRYAAATDLEKRVLPRFDVNADGAFDEAELKSLRESDPDIRLTLAFDTRNPSESNLRIVGVADEFSGALAAGKAEATSVTLPIGGTLVEFSSIQRGRSDQISVGSVNDGYPLLPVIDPNDDGRFTIRELRTLIGNLQKFDANDDGRLTADETRSTIRVCLGLGPHVHRELAQLRATGPGNDSKPIRGPIWFVRADRNKDNDLSTGEFQGNKKQFQEVDADGDGLIHVSEAVEYMKNQSPPAGETENDSDDAVDTKAESQPPSDSPQGVASQTESETLFPLEPVE